VSRLVAVVLVGIAGQFLPIPLGLILAGLMLVAFIPGYRRESRSRRLRRKSPIHSV
jgi:hypothetical protein